MVKKVATKQEFDDIIKNSPGLVIVDFFATWCGPCLRIAPYLEELSKEFTDVIFIKVDVDENEGAAGEAGVTAMPTFHAYKGGSKVGEVVGANQAKLKQLVVDNK